MRCRAAHSLLLSLALTGLLALPASAVAPDGQYFFDFTGGDQLLVLAGDVDLSRFFGFAALCKDIKIGANGKFKGGKKDCNVRLPVANGKDLKGKVSGFVKREDGVVKVISKLPLQGQVKGGGKTFDIDYLFKTTLKIADGASEGTYKTNIRACVDNRCNKGKSSFPISSLVLASLGIVTSNWTLLLDVETAADNKITGTGVVQTAAGQTVNFKVKGEYVPGDSSTIKLKPTRKKDRGAKIVLEDFVDAAGIADALMTLKLFGNTKDSGAVTSVPLP